MVRILLVFVCFAYSLAAAPDNSSQTPARAVKARKRVGIALAGGGARGLAHIGVIQWMEEHRIPIDAIAGSSMGALVAGVYASGRNGKEIREFVDGIDWAAALGSKSSYPDLTFRRKEDQRAFPASVEIGVRGGSPQLPVALNAGHQVELHLARIGFDYSSLQSFNDLPTPFRCVATDLLSGEKVVFHKGSLSLALRATMALPAIFSPVPHQGMLLVDGGLVDNLPADVVREMNVNVVIAVDLGMEPVNSDSRLSIIDVANRSIDVMMRRNIIESLKKADVAVKLLPFNNPGFQKIDEIVKRGYQAAQSMTAELSEYAMDEDEWRQYLKDRRTKTRSSAFTPKFVEVTGALPGDARVSSERFAGLLNRPLDRDRLENGLNRTAGLGLYEAAGYRQAEQGGKRGLEIDLRRNSHGPPFIQPLFILDSGQAGLSSFTFAARLSTFDFLTRNSEWRTDISFGRVNSVGTELYQFVGWRRLFVAPRGFASKEQQIIFERGDRRADYKITRAGGGFDVGYNFGPSSEIRTGIEVASARGQVLVGVPVLPPVRGTEQIWTTRWKFNELNSGKVPTRGLLVDSELNWQFHSPRASFAGRDVTPEAFGQAWSQVIYARPISARWTGLFRFLGGGTFGGEVQPLSEFRLGGPFRLGALEVGELRGAHFGFASAGILRQVYASSFSALGRVYVMGAYEGGDAFDSRPSLVHSGTAGIMAETTLGVLSVGFSYGEGGRRGYFFSLGRIFEAGVRNSSQVR